MVLNICFDYVEHRLLLYTPHYALLMNSLDSRSIVIKLPIANIVPSIIPISLKFVHLDINAHYNHSMSDTSVSDSYNEMVVETPNEEE